MPKRACLPVQDDTPPWPHRHVTILTPDVKRNQWVKKIRGRVHSFGIVRDAAGRWSFEDCATAALKQYQEDGPALHAGLERNPHAGRRSSVTIGELLVLYLQSKRADLEAGSLDRRTYRDYHDTCARVGAFFGKRKPVASLEPTDFEALLRSITWGPTRRRNFVTWTRQVFNWALDPARLIEATPVFGKAFKGSTAKERRALKNRSGENFLPAADVRVLLAAAERGSPLRAMILLGINCGFGNTDCAQLPIDVLDLDNAVLRYPRPKTEVRRVVPLWPETVEALRLAIENRPRPRPEAEWHVFVTRFGNPWVHGTTDGIGVEFRRLLRATGIVPPARKQKGDVKKPRKMAVGFYTLRRTFRTIADDAGDQHAVHLIMGHSLPGMSGVYVQKIRFDRLERVAKHVRHWLLNDAPGGETTDLLAGQRVCHWLTCSVAAPHSVVDRAVSKQALHHLP